jgi:hypothetical protein
MPTTFTVFSLGKLSDIDTTEGNNFAEGAATLANRTFGATDTPLHLSAATFSPGPTGYAGGTSTSYDQDNSPAESFRINGGTAQVFDSTAIYNATITYDNGTTATITAVLFQDTAGNTYWAPEFTSGADQIAMEANPIRSLTLNSLSSNEFSGLTGNRLTWNYVTCYVRGTHILTDQGERPIEALVAGDLVMTKDHGLQPIRWIGCSSAVAMGKLAPVCISQGALGLGLPHRDMFVSRQHRMMLQSKIAQRMFGIPEMLVPAIKLTTLPGVDVDSRPALVDYFHILTDRHEVIFAEGAASETLLTGDQARRTMGADAVQELETLFPGLIDRATTPARPIIQNSRLTQFLQRHQKNGPQLAA